MNGGASEVFENQNESNVTRPVAGMAKVWGQILARVCLPNARL